MKQTPSVRLLRGTPVPEDCWGKYVALDLDSRVVACDASKERARLLAGSQGYPRPALLYCPRNGDSPV